ncbi:MAG: S16 family serine protease [Solirubrobacterales bacterium]
MLWAANQSDGTVAGGIEKATVEVRQIGEPGFTLNLKDIAAKGAGSQWQAASSSAAAVGTLISGSDPNEVDVTFDVTGPIDGPSGGAALAVGVLAAIRGDELRSGVTMTGTVNPNGSVGVVTNVVTKVRSAAEDGYDTVLIPVGTEVEFDPVTGKEVDIVRLGRSLGVEVEVIPDVGTAYRYFTGKSVAPDSTTRPRVGRSVGPIARRTTARLIARTSRVIAAAGPGVIAASTLGRAGAAREAEARGELALGDGLGVDALKAAARDELEAGVGSAIDSGGESAAASLLGKRIRALKGEARKLTSRAIRRAAGLGFEQQLLVPVALGWITYSSALLEVVGQRLDRGQGLDPRALLALAGVVADSATSIEVFGPDALEAALASSPRLPDPPGSERTGAFLSGYTNFLVRGGRASERYFRDVVEAVGLGGAAPFVSPTLRVLGRQVDRIPRGINPIEAEIAQASSAISYFALGAILVSGDSTLGLRSFGLGREIGRGSGGELLPAAVEGATSTVYAWSSALQRRGLDMGYPTWSTDWGRAGFEGLSKTGRKADGAVLALEEAWYSAVGCFMLNGITATTEGRQKG